MSSSSSGSPCPFPSTAGGAQRLLHRVVSLDAEEDDGDVVLAAAGVGRAHELSGGVVEGRRGGEDAEDVVVRHHRREPVGAEEEEVARLGLDRGRVDVDLGIGAERARDHRALRVGVGLLGREPSAPHEVADERVVLGQLLQLAVADPVRARVADVAERDPSAREEGRRHRRPHAGDVGVGPRPLVDAPVRLLDDRLHPLVGREPVGLVVLAEAAAARREATSPACAPPMPSATGEQRRVEDEGVLVPAADAARVGPACALAQPHRSNRSSVSPTWTRSPSCSRLRPSMRSPFTYVPFVEPRSITQVPSSPLSTRAWWPEA